MYVVLMHNFMKGNQNLINTKLKEDINLNPY